MIERLQRMLRRVTIRQPETRPPEAAAGELSELQRDSQAATKKKAAVLEEFRAIERSVQARR
jgi:hypothetical protein